MNKWKCTICNWIYDPDIGDKEYGIPPGEPFEDQPDDYRCPKCGAVKKWFEQVE